MANRDLWLARRRAGFLFTCGCLCGCAQHGQNGAMSPAAPGHVSGVPESWSGTLRAAVTRADLEALVADPGTMLPADQAFHIDSIMSDQSVAADLPRFDLLVDSVQQRFVIVHHCGFSGRTTQHGPFAMDTKTGAVRLLR